MISGLEKDKIVAARKGSPLLLGLLRQNRGGFRHVRLRRGGLLLGQPHLGLKPLDRVCNPLVLLADGAEVVELLEQVGEGLGLQQDLELAGLVALVELNEALLEPALRDRVLLGQTPKRGGTLVVGMSQDLPGLDPHPSTSTITFRAALAYLSGA